MSERSLTIWKLLITFAILSIVAGGFSLYPKNKIIVDNLKWNGQAKKSGFEMGDYISELKIENSNRPNKIVVYPIAILFLLIFGYLNYKREK